jgi:hypothetical protein
MMAPLRKAVNEFSAAQPQASAHQDASLSLGGLQHKTSFMPFW